MSRKMRAGSIVALAFAAGVLLASNMGFSVPYPLIAAGGDLGNGGTSADGVTAICLPYRPGNLQNASDLINDVNSTAGTDVVVAVSRLNRLTDQFESFSGGQGETDFPLEPGTGYRIEVSANVDYFLVGSHDPTRTLTLLGPEDPGSPAGRNSLCLPYNALAQTAGDLMREINESSGTGATVSIERYVRSTGALEVYTGLSGGTDFALRPGEGYLVIVNKTVRYAPLPLQ